MLKLNFPEQKGTKFDTSTWEQDGWPSVVPDDMPPLTARQLIYVGDNATIGEGATIGDRVHIANDVTNKRK